MRLRNTRDAKRQKNDGAYSHADPFTINCADAKAKGSIVRPPHSPVAIQITVSVRMAGIQTIGVVGAGQMGNGIAHVCALAGYDVLLNDVSQERLDAGITTISRNMERQVARKLISAADREQALKRIRLSAKMTDFGNVDFAIEAATEKEAIKREIFANLCAVLPKTAILATNTSSISVTRLGATTDRPERFLGLHFMNPVPLMQLVEVIRGLATDQATYEAAIGLAERIGKKVVNAEDFPAFIVNRVLMPLINEAIYTLYGRGRRERCRISTPGAMKLGAQPSDGPAWTLADFIGLDTCLSIMQVLHEGLSDTKYRPCPLMAKYVEAGWLGKKVGRGFYDYRGETPVPTR